MKINLLIIICLLSACTPLTQTSTSYDSQSKVLQYTDRAYEPQIKTIVIKPGFSDPATYLEPAVTQLGHWNLRLEFDDLQSNRDYYYLRIVHCNRDWTRSALQDLDFMTEYNEFPITSFEYSVNTHLPYIHYWIDLPAVKLPGNYVAVVYRQGNKNDILLSKRFMIYDSRIAFSGERNLIGAGTIAAINQQLNFTVSYKDLEVINPLENLHVTIMQNHRWDNMAQDIRPSFVREIEKQVEYRFFDGKDMFKGGSEFRFFDLRSLLSPGRNIASVDNRARPFEVYIERDKPRSFQAYSQYDDYNGHFIIANLDYSSINFANYAFVNFTLASPPIDGRVYVTGAFHNWARDEENLMHYDSARREYTARLLLKQGWYDYQYAVESSKLPYYELEGSHFETENYYEILVYYRPFQLRADLLVGYLRLAKNER